MNKFNELDQFLGKKQDRPYGNNTRVQKHNNGKIAIKYHDTDIMLFSENEIIMDCEGWRSSTTKSRLNDNLPSPWTVYQDKNQWYLWDRKNDIDYVFKDGITIQFVDDYYVVCGKGDLSDVKKRQKLIRQINKYANDYVTEFVAGNIPAPSNGDCLFCHMTGWHGDDHLLFHMEEKYYVPSLLLNAINEFQISPMASWVIGEKWQESEKVEFAYDTFKDQAKKSIAKYMKRQLKLA